MQNPNYSWETVPQTLASSKFVRAQSKPTNFPSGQYQSSNPHLSNSCERYPRKSWNPAPVPSVIVSETNENDYVPSSQTLNPRSSSPPIDFSKRRVLSDFKVEVVIIII